MKTQTWQCNLINYVRKSILVVNNGAYLTLHYRLATLDGEDIISTFHESPATLLLGQGQLAPFLEEALIGLEEGSHTPELAPEQAFGLRNPDFGATRVLENFA